MLQSTRTRAEWVAFVSNEPNRSSAHEMLIVFGCPKSDIPDILAELFG